MQQLSPQDAMFAFMEAADTPSQLAWLNIYDPSTAPGGKVRFKAILEHVERRLHTARFFRQKLAFVPGNLGEPFWVDDPAFDLEHHVRHVALPAPGDWRQLCILAARVFARRFDLGKPLWEFTVIEGLDNVAGFPRGSFALLANMHHTAIDGISGVDVTTSLHTAEADATLPPPPPWRAGPTPSGSELMLRSHLARAANPGRRVRTIVRNLPLMRRVKEAIDSGELRKPPKRKVPVTRFSGAIGPHRVMEGRRFRLDDIRPIRALVPGATVNDALLAIVSGSMRRYLRAKGELPDETLIATCPVSLRTDEERGKLGNKVGNMFVPLATDVADPVERLRRIQQETANAKGINALIGAKALAEFSELMPGALVSLGTRLSAQLGASGVANTTVTNVPGPQKPLYLAGARLVTQFALPPLLHGLGIFHVVLSYCGEITVTLLADRDKLPDPGFYAECIDAAYEELHAAVRVAAAGGAMVGV